MDLQFELWKSYACFYYTEHLFYLFHLCTQLQVSKLWLFFFQTIRENIPEAEGNIQRQFYRNLIMKFPHVTDRPLGTWNEVQWKYPLIYLTFFMKSQNHRTAETWKHLWRLATSILLLKQGLLCFECLQGWRVHRLSGHTHRKKWVFSYVQMELPVL